MHIILCFLIILWFLTNDDVVVFFFEAFLIFINIIVIDNIVLADAEKSTIWLTLQILLIHHIWNIVFYALYTISPVCFFLILTVHIILIVHIILWFPTHDVVVFFFIVFLVVVLIRCL